MKRIFLALIGNFKIILYLFVIFSFFKLHAQSESSFSYGGYVKNFGMALTSPAISDEAANGIAESALRLKTLYSGSLFTFEFAY